METTVIRDNISRAAELIKAGALVAVPTETVYGLASSWSSCEVFLYSFSNSGILTRSLPDGKVYLRVFSAQLV